MVKASSVSGHAFCSPVYGGAVSTRSVMTEGAVRHVVERLRGRAPIVIGCANDTSPVNGGRKSAAPWLSRSLIALLAQVPGDVFVDVFEHVGAFLRGFGAEDADLLGFAAGGAHVLDGFFLRDAVLLFRPFAERDQVIAQAFDRIAERPLAAFVSGAILRRIVRG
jgi:hypothetical protein